MSDFDSAYGSARNEFGAAMRNIRSKAGYDPEADDEDYRVFDDYVKHSTEWRDNERATTGNANAGYDSESRSWADLFPQLMAYQDVRYNRDTQSSGGVGGDADPDANAVAGDQGAAVTPHEAYLAQGWGTPEGPQAGAQTSDPRSALIEALTPYGGDVAAASTPLAPQNTAGGTLAPGRSITADQANQFIAQVRAQGADDAWIQQFLAADAGAGGNNNDYSRLPMAWAQQQANKAANTVGSEVVAGGGDATPPGYPGANPAPPTPPPVAPVTPPPVEPGLPVAPPPTTPTTPTTPAPTADVAPPPANPALQALIETLQGDLATQKTERADLREILKGELGRLQDPVSLDDPGIKEAVAAHRVGLQRGTEQQRREAAERRAYDDSGGMGSKGYMTDVDRLQQQAGEAGAAFEGQTMFSAMQTRQAQLQSLLTNAISLGDAETANLIRAELAGIGQQIGEGQFGTTTGLQNKQLNQQASQFAADLDFRFKGQQIDVDQFASNDAYRKQVLGQNADQFLKDLDYKYKGLDIDWQKFASDEAYRRDVLAQNQGQFEDTTAFNYNQLGANMNTQALLTLLQSI